MEAHALAAGEGQGSQHSTLPSHHCSQPWCPKPHVGSPSPGSAMASQREANTQQEAPEMGPDGLSWLQLPDLCLAPRHPSAPCTPPQGPRQPHPGQSPVFLNTRCQNRPGARQQGVRAGRVRR